MAVTALLRPVFAELRVGWPDDTVDVDVEDVDALREALHRVIATLSLFWRPVVVFADVSVYAPKARLDVRIACGVGRAVVAEEEAAGRAAVDAVMPPLVAVATKNGGEVQRGWGGSNIHLMLPVRESGPEIATREDHPTLGASGNDWEGHYAGSLARTSWSQLRDMAYRFSNFATAIASRTPGRVLTPSVGLCVHPWLFAARGWSVIATEIAQSALGALAEPHLRPRLFGQEARRRWGMATAALYGGFNPHRFDGMPSLEDAATVASLRPRIELVRADWKHLPIPDASVDVVFATNALPRNGGHEDVVREWARVAKRDALVFSVMHNAHGVCAGPTLESLGFRAIDALGGEMGEGLLYQEWLSSG